MGDSQTGREPLRIGTSGDYSPFSIDAGGELTGFDIDVADAFADDLGLPIEWVRFRWPELQDRFVAGDFDVVMSGVTVRPERSVAGRFSLPVAIGGAVALVAADGPFHDVTQLDSAAVSIAVNQGGHLERVTLRHFPRARIEPIGDNRLVPSRLLEGSVDAVVTDTFEAPDWLSRRSAPALRALAPFTRDAKAYWVAPGEVDLAKQLDRWLAARERDGTLATFRALSLRVPASEEASVAAPLPALLAAVEERLSLMPFVAEVKRAAGAPIAVPAVEERVVTAGLDAVAGAARSADAPAPPAHLVENLYRALIDAAKQVQRAQLERPPDAARARFDLDADLRPALLRIGERIAAIVVRLHGDAGALDDAAIRDAVDATLGGDDLDDASIDAIARAIGALQRQPATARHRDQAPMPEARTARPARIGSARQSA